VSAAPELSMIVVHWRGEEDLARLLAAVGDAPRVEVVVVDNGSRGALPPLGAARLVRPPSNLGFGGGANLGAAVASAPLLLFANPDARPEPGALAALFDGFATAPDAAGLAPRLVGEDGVAQTAWQLRALPGPATLVRHGLFRDASRANAGEPGPGAPVAQPAAAALALRRDAFEALGGFDSTFHPAWFEDVDLARRLAARGLVVRYWPAAVFRHRLGGSVAPLGYGRFLWTYHRNLGRYLAKHHGRGWALLARLVLLAGVLLRLLLVPLRRPRRAASARDAGAGLLAVALGTLTGWRRPRRFTSPEGPA
jgi:N-acetylglucosaminyl-diphospho-decaprenol L-rhamnosyltransferase